MITMIANVTNTANTTATITAVFTPPPLSLLASAFSPSASLPSPSSVISTIRSVLQSISISKGRGKV